MLRDERLQKIENFVKEHKRASFQELIDAFALSKATIRRDLKLLEEEDRLTLVRGGAVIKESAGSYELPYHMKLESNSLEKERIAKRAVELVRPGSTIIIDSGTTTRYMVQDLAALSYVHIITCDIVIATECSSYPNLDVTLIGGKLRSGYYNLYGYIAECNIQTLNADLAFCSIDAVNAKGDCMISNIEEVSIKNHIRTCAPKSILLCDHSKFGINSVVKVCSAQDIDMIICGKELEQKEEEVWAALKDRIILV